VAELDGSNVVVSRFVHGSRGGAPEYMVKAGTTYRIIADHLGSVRLVVDVGTGNVAQRMDYDEFGNVVTNTNPGFQPFGFAGGLHDEQTGLVRFGARDYDPATGRWTTKDPILFRGRDTNLYAYVFADPVNVVDRNGLAPKTACPVKPVPPGDNDSEGDPELDEKKDKKLDEKTKKELDALKESMSEWTKDAMQEAEKEQREEQRKEREFRERLRQMFCPLCSPGVFSSPETLKQDLAAFYYGDLANRK